MKPQPLWHAVDDCRGETEGELSFSAGDIIFLARRVNAEWLEGEAQGSGATGIFPAGFVEIVEGLRGEGEADELDAQEGMG
jgi:hypothetical protein